MAKLQESVEVNASAAECYARWMCFEDFPQFMDHVKSVTSQGDRRWHWIVDGPFGKKLEWDAEIDGNERDRIISWHSISEPDVGVQGAVLFEELSPELTRITSTIQYQPPAGAVGELVAQVFSNPEQMVRQDLDNFKKLMESGVTTAGYSVEQSSL